MLVKQYIIHHPEKKQGVPGRIINTEMVIHDLDDLGVTPILENLQMVVA